MSPRYMAVSPLLRTVADSLDIVAVRVADEGPVVVLVVVLMDPRLVQHLGAVRHGGREELVHLRPARGRERDVRLAEAVTLAEFTDPEVGVAAGAVADGDLEVHQPAAAQRGEHRV